MSSPQHDLITSNINQTLIRMTIPMIVGMIMLMSFGLIDTFFVSLLGTEALAAISFTFPVTFTVISLNIGLGIGAAAVIGKLIGQKSFSEAKETATAAIMLAIVLVGILATIGAFTITPIFRLLGANEVLLPLIHDYMIVWYLSGVLLAIPMVSNAVLRASGDTKTPSIIMAVGGAINAALDPLLIFGFGPVPAMGIQGAALATVISWFICSIWVLRLLAVDRKLMLPRWLSISELKQYGQGVIRIGFPAAGANMLTPIAGAVMTAIVAVYGAESVAAWGVGNRMESIASIVILALSMSLPPFISNNLGAGKIDRVLTAYRSVIVFIVVWQFLVFLVIWSLSPFIAQIFADEERVSSLIVLFLSIVPLGYGLQGIVILTNSSLNAMHLPMGALWLNIIRLFVFYVPIAWLSSQYFGLKGLFWGCVIGNVLMAIVSLIWFKRAIATTLKQAVQQVAG